MIRTFFVLLILVIPTLLNVQNITGILTDYQSEKGISGATLQLIDSQTNATVSYVLSDDSGKFTLALPPPGNYILEINHIAYDPEYHQLSVSNSGTEIQLPIKLRPKSKQLNEVIVQGSRAAAQQKGDTIRYNINAFTTGNEEKLKNIIEKLPGLEIDDNGKIKSQGKVIEELLINGKPFFGKNHKMATENLNAKMIDDIDLINNYETFGAIKDIEGTNNKKALNIHIKEEYLGKITGDIAGLSAYDDRYKMHSNLFRFMPKFNASAILDSNNLGEQAISLRDYMDMDGNIKSDIRNNDMGNPVFGSGKIPKFLVANENNKTSRSHTAALNISAMPTDKLSINAFSILNQSRFTEQRWVEKTFFNTTNPLQSEDAIAGKMTFLFNQTKVNLEYKPNKDNLINYSAILDSGHDKGQRDTESILNGQPQNFEEDNKAIKLNFGQQLSYVTKLARNKLLSINAYQEFKKQDNRYDFLSDQQTLLPPYQRLDQQYVFKSNEIGIFSKYTQKISDHIVRGNAGFIWNRSSLELLQSALVTGQPQINRNSNYAFADVSVKKAVSLLQYNAKLEFRNYFLQPSGTTKAYLLPFAQVKLAFTDLHYLSLSYNRNISFYASDLQNNFLYADDYRNYYNPSTIIFEKPFEQNILSLNYFKFDLYNGFLFLANSSYSRNKNENTSNSINAGNYNYIAYRNDASGYSWNNLMSVEQRIKPLKSKAKATFSYWLTESYNFIGDQQNDYRTNNFSVRFSLISSFKDSWFNYEVGSQYSNYETHYQLFDSKIYTRKWTPFLNFNGQINESLIYRLDNSLEHFSTTDSERQFFKTDFKLTCKKPKTRFKYWIEGNNIFNISNPEIIATSNSNNSFSRETITRLAGYIGFGIGFEW